MDFRPLDKNDYKPLYAQLSEILVEYIQQNNLKPGDPIPSQNELEKYFDVSQMTIRLALQRLASEGYITRLQGRGTFVAEKKLSFSPDSVVPFEEQMFHQGIQVENELIEEIIVHPIEMRRLELKLPEGSNTYKIRRVKRIAGEPVCLETNHMPPDFKGRFTQQDITTLPFLTLFNRDTETTVTDIDYTIKSVLLLQLESDYLNVPLDTPALVQHRVIFSKERPILAGRLVYLADKVEIRFKISKSATTFLTAVSTTNT